ICIGGLKVLSPRPKVYFHEAQYSQGFGKMPVCQKTSPLLIAKIMLVKYIVGLLLFVLFKSLQGADTIFLSDIRETGKDFPYARKFYISADSSFIDLFFCNRKNA